MGNIDCVVRGHRRGKSLVLLLRAVRGSRLRPKVGDLLRAVGHVPEPIQQMQR